MSPNPSPSSEPSRRDIHQNLSRAFFAPTFRKVSAVPAIAPLVPEKWHLPFDNAAYVFEVKLDGFRCVATKASGKVSLSSKKQKELNIFPEIAKEVEKLPGIETAVLDGEVVFYEKATDKVTQRTFERTSFMDLFLRKKPVCYCLFDIMYLNGRDLRELPLTQRKEILKSVVPAGHPVIRYSTHLGEHGIALFELVQKNGLEGIVAKLANAPYRLLPNGKAPWIKVLNSARPKDNRAALINRRRT